MASVKDFSAIGNAVQPPTISAATSRSSQRSTAGEKFDIGNVGETQPQPWALGEATQSNGTRASLDAGTLAVILGLQAQDVTDGAGAGGDTTTGGISSYTPPQTTIPTPPLDQPPLINMPTLPSDTSGGATTTTGGVASYVPPKMTSPIAPLDQSPSVNMPTVLDRARDGGSASLQDAASIVFSKLAIPRLPLDAWSLADS